MRRRLLTIILGTILVIVGPAAIARADDDPTQNKDHN